MTTNTEADADISIVRWANRLGAESIFRQARREAVTNGTDAPTHRRIFVKREATT